MARLFKNKAIKFFDKVIYPTQFAGDTYKLIFHIVNLFYPICKGNIERIKVLVSAYIRNYDAGQLNEILEKYEYAKQNMFRLNSFTHLTDILQPDDYKFRNATRNVTLKEFQFIAQRITQNLYKSEGCKSVIVTEYFLNEKHNRGSDTKTGLPVEYHRYTKRQITKHKVIHIIHVLAKYKYFNQTYSNTNQRILQIGPANPYYELTEVPDITTEDIVHVRTQEDRKMQELNSAMKTVTDALRKEQESSKNQSVYIQQIEQDNYELKKEIEILKQDRKYMMNSWQESMNNDS